MIIILLVFSALLNSKLLNSKLLNSKLLNSKLLNSKLLNSKLLNSKQYACGAGPLMYGPDCIATDCINSAYNDMIVYTIDEIISNTNIECIGKGFNNVFSCSNNKFTWYPLGLLKEGDSATLFWGKNSGCPEIKCKGQPLPTLLKWSWKMKANNKKCCRNQIYDPDINGCCRNNLYDPMKNICCTDDSGSILCPRKSDCCGSICYNKTNNICCDDVKPPPNYQQVFGLCNVNDWCLGLHCCRPECVQCCVSNGTLLCAKQGEECCVNENGIGVPIICNKGGCCGWNGAQKFCCKNGCDRNGDCL